jgi:hypothetical protein
MSGYFFSDELFLSISFASNLAASTIFRFFTCHAAARQAKDDGFYNRVAGVLV